MADHPFGVPSGRDHAAAVAHHAEGPGPVWLRLLGYPGIYRADKRLCGPASHRHRLALLTLLATHAHLTRPRDTLIGWLWPEADLPHARHLLNCAVHAIRAALGDEALASEGGELRLACSRLTADLWAFQSALAANALDQAVRLHAAPFLHGFSLPGAPEFDHWVELRRREVTDQYLNALERLAAAADGCADRVMAVARWRELAEASPYNSRFAIGLIEALCRSGDRGGRHHGGGRARAAPPPRPRGRTRRRLPHHRRRAPGRRAALRIRAAAGSPSPPG